MVGNDAVEAVLVYCEINRSYLEFLHLLPSKTLIMSMSTLSLVLYYNLLRTMDVSDLLLLYNQRVSCITALTLILKLPNRLYVFAKVIIAVLLTATIKKDKTFCNHFLFYTTCSRNKRYE